MSNIFTKGGMRHAEAPQLPGAWSEVSLAKQRTMSSKFKDMLSAHAYSFYERAHHYFFYTDSLLPSMQCFHNLLHRYFPEVIDVNHD